jgi:hypothetical protein
LLIDRIMKMKIYKKFLIPVIVGMIAMTSCLGDLDTIPLDEDVTTAATVYDNPEVYRQVLAKCYAILAVSGQEGPHGMPDISGIDEGFSNYVRQYWKAQELTTDEATITWADGTIQDYHEQDWSSSSEFVTAIYNRIFYMISITNELIRESADEKLVERDVPESIKDDVAIYRAEARFLRAMAYWHAIDLFGNVPFVLEEDAPGSFFPEQINRAELFSFIESELIELETLLPEPKANEYGRVDRVAAWTLLSKLYLNAEVYIETDKYTECLTYANKVITSGYGLHPVFEELFMADNHTVDGIIFPVTFDGVHTRTWGGMTFLIHAAVGGNMIAADYGVDGGWNGLRMTKEAVSKFIDISSLKGARNVSYLKSVNAYPEIYVPGAHQEWDPPTAPALGSVSSDDNYEGYVWFDAGTEYKFTPARDWVADWGDDGADGTLEAGGANIMAVDAGYYKLNVDVAGLTYTAEATSWGIIGDATPGAWDSDTDMTYDAATDSWSAVITLGAGELKFRANDDWVIDLGDTDSDDVLDYGGDNIPITEAGSYLVTLFLGSPDYTYTLVPYANDARNALFSDGQSLEIDDNSDFQQGYAFPKFSNITSSGATGSDLAFPDTDFPMFRLADVYLIYAEAVLRGGSGGDASAALGYVNQIRERAYGGTTGNIDAADLDLDFILDERVRELAWEGHRRTDLIRYGRFSDSDYLWAWKGGLKEGKSVDSKYDLFPIPSSDMGANPSLNQNTGY